MITLAWTAGDYSAWIGVAVTVLGIVATYVRALAKISEVEDHVKQLANNYNNCRGLQDQRHEDIRDGLADIRERLARLEALTNSIVTRLDSIATSNGKRRGGRNA